MIYRCNDKSPVIKLVIYVNCKIQKFAYEI